MRGCNEAPGYSNVPAHFNPTTPSSAIWKRKSWGINVTAAVALNRKMISFYQKKNSLHQRTKEITDKFSNSSATLPEIPTMFLQLLTTFFQFLFILCHLLPYPRLKGGQSHPFLFSCVKGLDFIVFKVLLCSHLRPSSHNDSYERPYRLNKFLLHTLYAHQSEKRRGWHSRACSYIP